MKKVVILGGGFAGIAAIKGLQKNLTSEQIQITLIDKNPYHLFTPSLYEVATSEEPKKNIAIPFREIFEKHVDIVQGNVEKIDSKKQIIAYSTNKNSPSNSLQFDYLLIALGSEPAYFHIPELKEYSIALKSLKEAVMIKNHIKNLCCKEGKCNRKVRVVIGGGGFSGTELAAELLTYKNKIAKQHHLDPNCLDITIIQGSDRLLKELDDHVGKIAEKRLQQPMVHFAFGGHINKVTKTSVFTDDNKVYHYDILIWTGGVQANSVLSQSGLTLNKRGQLIVNDFLQVDGYVNIFAAGDNTQFLDKKTQNFAPTVAEVAEDEGKVVGENIARLVLGKNLIPYVFHHLGYIVPLKGRYAAAELMGIFHFDGLIAWIIQQFVLLYYLLKILPFTKAWKRWDTFELDLQQ